MESTSWGGLGLTHIDTLRDLYADGPRSVSCDFARYRATDLATLASLGYITNLVNGNPTRQWRLTEAGYYVLEPNT